MYGIKITLDQIDQFSLVFGSAILPAEECFGGTKWYDIHILTLYHNLKLTLVHVQTDYTSLQASVEI